MTMKIKLLKHQLEAYQDIKTQYVAMCGGFRSGKTVAGAIVTARNALLNAPFNVNGLILGQSTKQTHNVLVKKFVEVLDSWGIKKVGRLSNSKQNTPTYAINNNSGSIDIFNGGGVSQHFIFTERSLLDNGLGYELGHFWVDELDTFAYDNATRVWEILSTRMSPMQYGVLQGIATSTPEGFQFMHKFFEEDAAARHEMLREEQLPADSRIITASMFDNPYLSKAYIQSKIASLPKNKHAAYIYGRFANIVGLEVYCNYNRHENGTNISLADYPEHALHIGMDFNVGKMAAIIHIVVDGQPIAVDEIQGARDTPAIINIIHQKYPKRKIYIYPDPASVANNANGGVTTYAQLKAAFEVVIMKSHPLIINRVNSMNAIFAAPGKKKYLVNAVMCPTYVKCLERQVYDKAGQPDKSGDVDHPVDAAGYFIYTNWPLQGKPTIRSY